MIRILNIARNNVSLFDTFTTYCPKCPQKRLVITAFLRVDFVAMSDTKNEIDQEKGDEDLK